MFNIKPLSRASSYFINKYLSKYIKNFDKSNIDINILTGQITLKNVQLNDDLFKTLGLEFEIIESIVESFFIQFRPLKIKLKGVKLIVKNIEKSQDYDDQNNKENQDTLNKIKKESLVQFENKFIKEYQTQTGGKENKYLDYIIEYLKNIDIEINDILIEYIHISNNKDISKLGFELEQLKVQRLNVQSQKNLFMAVKIILKNFQIYFQHYSHLESSINNYKNYFINNLDITTDIEVNYREGDFIYNINLITNNIIIFLKQEYLLVILRIFQDIYYYKKKRPIYKPGENNGSQLWWKYAISQILKKQKTLNKQNSINGFHKVIQNMLYQKFYIKNFICKQALSKNEQKLFDRFENQNSLQNIIKQRILAFKALENTYLNSQGFNKCEVDFKQIDQQLVKTLEEKSKIQDKDQKLGLDLELKFKVPQFDIFIQENDFMTTLKKYQNQIQQFKSDNKQENEFISYAIIQIRQKFIDNFIQGNFSDKLYEKNNIKWNVDDLKKQKQFLQISISNIQLNLQQRITSQIYFSFDQLNGYDLTQSIQEYQNFLSISHRIDVKYQIQDINDMDTIIYVKVPKIIITICKPLIERIISVSQILFFDPYNCNQDKQNYYDESVFNQLFNQILFDFHQVIKKNPKVNVQIQKININLPFQFDAFSKMMVFQFINIQYNQQTIIKKLTSFNKNMDLHEIEQELNEPVKYINLTSFKLLIVNCFNWEDHINILQNMKPLENKKINILTETLPIKFKLIQKCNKQNTQKQIIHFEDKEINYKRPIYIDYIDISILLPFIFLNINISDYMDISALMDIWSLKQQPIYEEIKNNFKSQKVKLKQPLIQQAVPHQIISENIIEYLKNLNLSLIDLNIEGLILNLNASEDLQNPKTFFRFYSQDINYTQKAYFYKNETEIKIKKLVLDYTNDPEFDLHSVIVQQCEKNTNQKLNIQKKTFKKSKYLIYNAIEKNNEQYQIKDIEIKLINYQNQIQDFEQEQNQQNSISVEQKNPVITIDPEFLECLQTLFDFSKIQAKKRVDCVLQYMIDNQIFFIQDQKIQNKVQNQVSKCQKNSVFKFNLYSDSIKILWMYHSKLLYLLNFNEFDISFQSFQIYSQLLIQGQTPKLFDISDINGNHYDILSGDESSIEIEVKIYDQNFASLQKYSTKCEIKLNKINLIFLKRQIIEIVAYFLKYFLNKILYPLLGYTTTSQPQEKQPSKFFLEIVILDSFIRFFRNSCSPDLLYIYFDKLGIWSTGQWGQNYTDFIKKGQFEWEDESFQDVKEEFESSFQSIIEENSNHQFESNVQETYKIELQNASFHIDQKVPNQTNFIDLQKNQSIMIKVVFEDFSECQKLNQIQPAMKIYVNIPTLQGYFYEPDFNLIIKTIQENLGEQPLNVIIPYVINPDAKEIGMIVDVNIKQGEIIFFNHSRQNVYEFMEKYKMKKYDFLNQNDYSLFKMNLDNLVYKMLFQNNGCSHMIVTSDRLNIADHRLNSIINYQRNIISSKIDNKMYNNHFNLQFQKFESDFTDYTVDEQLQFKNESAQEKLKITKKKTQEDINEKKENNQEQNHTNQELNMIQRVLQKFTTYKNRLFKNNENKQQFDIENQNDMAQIHHKSLDLSHIEKKHGLNNYIDEYSLMIDFKNEIESQKQSSPQNKTLNQDITKIEKEVPLFIEQYKDIIQPQVNYENLLNFYRDYHCFQDYQGFQLFMFGNSNYEKQININLNNMQCVLVMDFIYQMIDFFKAPFDKTKNPSQVTVNQDYNNFAPMNIKISLNQFLAILLPNIKEANELFLKQNNTNIPQSLGIFLDLKLQIQYLGDCVNGPGKSQNNIDILVKNIEFLNTAEYFYIAQRNKSLIIKDIAQVRINNSKEKLTKFVQELRQDLKTENLIKPFTIQLQQSYEIQSCLNKNNNQIEDLIDDLVIIKLYLHVKPFCQEFNNMIMINFLQFNKVKNLLGQFNQSTIQDENILEIIKMIKEKPPQVKQIQYKMNYEIKLDHIIISLNQNIKQKPLFVVTLGELILRVQQKQLFQGNDDIDKQIIAKINFDVQFLNSQIEKNEPVIENFTAYLMQDITLNNQTIKINSKQPQEEIESDKKHILNSLNINISNELILAFNKFIKEMNQVKDKMIFINKTGYPIQFANAHNSNNHQQKINIPKEQIILDKDNTINEFNDTKYRKAKHLLKIFKQQHGYKQPQQSYEDIHNISFQLGQNIIYEIKKINLIQSQDNYSTAINQKNIFQDNVQKLINPFILGKTNILSKLQSFQKVRIKMNLNNIKNEKTIQVTSTVKFKNQLNIAIRLLFKKEYVKKNKGQQGQIEQLEEDYTKIIQIQPKSTQYIPLEFLDDNEKEAITYIYFDHEFESGADTSHLEKYKLSHFICDLKQQNQFKEQFNEKQKQVLEYEEPFPICTQLEEHNPKYFQIYCQKNKIQFKQNIKKTGYITQLILYPYVQFFNCLIRPINIVFKSASQEQIIKPTEKKDFYNVNNFNQNFENSQEECNLQLMHDNKLYTLNKFIIEIDDYHKKSQIKQLEFIKNEENKVLVLIQIKFIKSQSLEFTLYTQYIIYNQINEGFTYQNMSSGDIHEVSEYQQSHNRFYNFQFMNTARKQHKYRFYKEQFNKKELNQILDLRQNQGFFYLKSNKKHQIVGYSIEQSLNQQIGNMTQIIVFYPYYKISNKSSKLLEIKKYKDFKQGKDSDDNILKLKENEFQDIKSLDFRYEAKSIVFRIQQEVQENNNEEQELQNFNQQNDGKKERVCPWSGPIPLNEGDYYIKLTMNNINYLFEINIQKIENVNVITINDLQNLPFKIQNDTQMQIFYQEISNEAERKQAPLNTLMPENTDFFTWQNWENHQNNRVQIEVMEQKKKYDLAGIQYQQIIFLNTQMFGKMYQQDSYDGNLRLVDYEVELLKNEENKAGFKHLLKDEDYKCTIKVKNKTLKIIDKKGRKTRIDLRNSNVNEINEREFQIEIGAHRSFIFHCSQQKKMIWILMIFRAIYHYEKDMILVSITPNKNTKTLKLWQYYQEDDSINDLEMSNSSHKRYMDESSIKKYSTVKNTNIIINIHNLSLSLIDSRQEKAYELLHIGIQGIYFDFEDKVKIFDQKDEKKDNKKSKNNQIQKKCHKMLSLKLLKIIVDNNDITSKQIPVLLAPNSKENRQSLEFSLQLNEENELTVIENAQIYLKTFEIRLNLQIIIQIKNFIYKLLENFQSQVDQENDEQQVYDIRKLNDKIENKIKKDGSANRKKIFVKNIIISPIVFLLTLTTNDGELIANEGNIFWGLGVNIGLNFLNLESAKVVLYRNKISNLYDYSDNIQNIIMNHYKNRIVNIIGELLGQLQIVKPFEELYSMIVDILQFGKDFIENFVQNDNHHGNIKELGLAFTKNTFQSIIKVFSRILKQVVQVLKIILKELSKIIHDPEYIQKRNQIQNRSIRTVRQGFQIAIQNLFYNIFYLIVYIFRMPITYIKEREYSKLIFQIVYGYLIIAIIVIIAIFDTLNLALSGILFQSEFHDNVMENPSRPPRQFANNQQVIPYNYDKALCCYLVDKQFFRQFIFYKKNIQRENSSLFVILYQYGQTILHEICNILKLKKQKLFMLITDKRFIWGKCNEQESFIRIKLHKIQDISFYKNHIQIVEQKINGQQTFKMLTDMNEQRGQQIIQLIKHLIQEDKNFQYSDNDQSDILSIN